MNDEEYKAVIQKFFVDQGASIYEAIVKGQTMYFTGNIGADKLGLAVIKQKMGGYHMANVVTDISKILRPRAIISVGVGWGNKQRLMAKNSNADFGDVMVSECVAEFTIDTKITQEGHLETRSHIPAAGTLLFNRFSSLAAPGRWEFCR